MFILYLGVVEGNGAKKDGGWGQHAWWSEIWRGWEIKKKCFLWIEQVCLQREGDEGTIWLSPLPTMFIQSSTILHNALWVYHHHLLSLSSTYTCIINLPHTLCALYIIIYTHASIKKDPCNYVHFLTFLFKKYIFVILYGSAPK